MMDFANARLPEKHKRNGKDCYLDPIRKQLIPATPEETIRQKVISYLIDTLEVPADMMNVEVSLSRYLSQYGVESRKRADIVIWGKGKNGNSYALTIIECKADNIPLDERVYDQAVEYGKDLGSTYIVLTNGRKTYCYKYEDTKDDYLPIKQLPQYEGMLTGECVPVEPQKPKKRIPYEKLEEELLNSNPVDEYAPWYFIHEDTSMELALPSCNLMEGLLDDSVKMPTGDYGLFELLKDYGLRYLTYGNASGGQYDNFYRSFLVKVDGNTELYSLCFNPCGGAGKDESKRRTFTYLCVAHDDEKKYHHALQLSIDKLAVADGKTVKFYHDGTIAVGNLGRGKGSELKELVEKRYPKIVMGDKYYLGSITADHLLRLDEPDVINLIVNLISYSIVREEYREIVKNRAKKNTEKTLISANPAAKQAPSIKKTLAKEPPVAPKAASVKKAPAAPNPAAKKATSKKLGKIIIEIDGQQIDIKAVEKKARMLSGDVYVVAAEKKIYDKDGKSVDLF